MTPEPQGTLKYGDAEGYDRYMGRWSASLAPLFLEFADLGRPASILDIGCGTGNLLAAAASVFPAARLVGVDPSASLLARARHRLELAGVEFIQAIAENLPLDDAGFDCCLSLLVLQEFPDRGGALAEMRRVTRRGGIVAACQWDFSRMPVIDALVEAIAATSVEAGHRIATGSPRVFADEAELRQCWVDTGLDDVTTGRIAVTRQFRDFDDLWLPLLAGSTPSTLTLASLPAPERAEVHERLRWRFGVEDLGAAFSVTAEALVVRGRV